MATLVHQCPHCMAERMSFNLVGQSYGGQEGDVRNFIYISCQECRMPSVAEVALSDGTRGGILADISMIPFSLAQHGWHVKEIWPAPPAPRMPDHLPDPVARAYQSAERNFHQHGMEEAAAASYGRALDIGTKIIAPDVKGMLNARIDALANENRITADLASWAHQIRSIRNSALHDIESMDREELTAIRGFAEMVLTYLFTLPGMLAARKADAGAAGEGFTPPAM